MEGGQIRAYTSSKISPEALDITKLLSERLLSDRILTKAAGLIVTSANNDVGDLQAFISAWSGLEMFVNNVFSARYEGEWHNVIQSAAPTSAKSAFKHLESVMTQRYRFLDRFLIVASLLSPNEASQDEAKIKTIKEQRDNLFHKAEGVDRPYPVAELQKIAIRYLRYHLENAVSK